MKTLKVFATVLLALFVQSCNSDKLEQSHETTVYDCLITHTVQPGEVPFSGINVDNVQIKVTGITLMAFDFTSPVEIEGYPATLKASSLSGDESYQAILIYTYGPSYTAYLQFHFTIVDGSVVGTWEERYPNSGIENSGTMLSGKITY